AAAWTIISGVSRPITAMTDAMRRLAGRDMTTEIAGQERGDEIGAMAAAVQVFKENMIAADRLATEQVAENATKIRRAGQIDALTSAFETKVGELVGALSSSSAAMEVTA